MNRREFLGQLAIALSLAGIVHTIPALATTPSADLEEHEVVLRSQIKGLAIFRQFLVIATEDGVFLAPAPGLGHASFSGHSLFVTLAPYVVRDFYIEHLGHPPHRLQGTPVAELRVVKHPLTGNAIFWSAREASSW